MMLNTTTPRQHNPLIISGPSGIGKSHLAQYLTLNYNCERVIPTTTRPPRSGETNGKDYNFLTFQQYQKIKAQNRFFMSNHFFASDYGIEREAVDSILRKQKTPIVEIYTPKVTQFLHEYPQAKAIFLIPESIELLEQRMHQRGDTSENIQYRLEAAIEELLYFNDFERNLYDECYIVSKTNFLEITQDITNKFSLERNSTLEGAPMLRR